jgi:hypothetical protein
MSDGQRHLRWTAPERMRPKHGYRDTLFVYLGLCVAVVLFGWLTGGGFLKSVVVAGIVFVAASVYSLVRWHDLARYAMSFGRRRG